MDKDYTYLAANPAYLKTIQKTSDQIIGGKVSSVFGEEFFNEVIKPNGDRCLGGEEVNYQEWFDFPDLGKVYMDISYYPHFGVDNEIKGFIVNGKDITDRKRAEDELEKHRNHLEELVKSRTEELEKYLEEKEILLKEVHHRTKNNMQIISSLLWLQSKDIQEEKHRGMFRDCSNRILSMALMHEKMYESHDLLEIDFHGYLASLLSDLFDSYGEIAERIEYSIETNGASLDLDSGIPCGLLIQELVSNSLKHAFPEDRRGKIYLVLHPRSNGQIELTVGDDGIGFPEGLDFRKTQSLGLQLVTTLAEKQLGGTIELDGKQGTVFNFIFGKGKI